MYCSVDYEYKYKYMRTSPVFDSMLANILARCISFGKTIILLFLLGPTDKYKEELSRFYTGSSRDVWDRPSWKRAERSFRRTRILGSD
jgi:hypothetical protein